MNDFYIRVVRGLLPEVVGEASARMEPPPPVEYQRLGRLFKNILVLACATGNEVLSADLPEQHLMGWRCGDYHLVISIKSILRDRYLFAGVGSEARCEELRRDLRSAKGRQKLADLLSSGVNPLRPA